MSRSRAAPGLGSREAWPPACTLGCGLPAPTPAAASSQRGVNEMPGDTPVQVTHCATWLELTLSSHIPSPQPHDHPEPADHPLPPTSGRAAGLVLPALASPPPAPRGAPQTGRVTSDCRSALCGTGRGLQDCGRGAQFGGSAERAGATGSFFVLQEHGSWRWGPGKQGRVSEARTGEGWRDRRCGALGAAGWGAGSSSSQVGSYGGDRARPVCLTCSKSKPSRQSGERSPLWPRGDGRCRRGSQSREGSAWPTRGPSCLPLRVALDIPLNSGVLLAAGVTYPNHSQGHSFLWKPRKPQA